MPRRDFLKAAAATSVLAGVGAAARPAAAAAAALEPSAPDIAHAKIQAFNYDGVTLGPSRWDDQFQNAREFYYNVENDDILHGFRAAANLPAPGKPLGGWCARDSGTVFGQWLSGMSRIYRATGDTQMRDKAVYLLAEYAKTVGPDGNCRMGPYPYEKMTCGLTDMHEYASHPEATALMDRMTGWASKTFDRSRLPAGPKPWGMHSGKPGEWYTMPENLFRAYMITGNQKFRDFGEVWLYHHYWDKFADTAAPTTASAVHAYSHVNSFSSASMAYAVTGDPRYLQICKNAYDFMQNTQCYATGGYGPVERIMPPGSLGKALEYQCNTCETPCDTWAGFKLSKYLTQFTGEARYGDWAERLLYNGIGAALQIHGPGVHFYYADYRVGAGVKIFSRNTYTCCSGTYIQNVADYHNQIYYRGPNALYVSLYVPSTLTWRRASGDVTLVQDTKYPEAETSTFTLKMSGSAQFPLNFRIPGWSEGVSFKVNGAPAQVSVTPGQWATIDREWKSGDAVEIRIPLRLRYSPVDKEHPHRVAVVRGPVVLVQDGNVHEPVYKMPYDDEALNKYIVADEREANAFRCVPADGANVMALFRPFYAIPADSFYRMHFDLDDLPMVLWSQTGFGNA